jgi:glutaredoxin
MLYFSEDADLLNAERLTKTPTDTIEGSPEMAGQAVHVEIFTRSGCSLCDEAERILWAVVGKDRLHLTKTDVDSDAELIARYGDSVPVVAIGGVIRFRGHVQPALLRRLL